MPRRYGSRTVTPTTNQPGLLDYVGEGWDALLDSGSPWFSPNHPAAIASRNIDWENPADQSNDPYIMEQLSIIANSIGGGSNIPGAIFPGGLLGGMVKRVPIKKGAKVKLEEGESIIAKSESGFGGDYILTKNPSKGQNWLEGAPSGDWKGTGIDMSKAPKKVAKPEGGWRISQMENMDPFSPSSDSWKFAHKKDPNAPIPWGHHAYDSFEDAWKKLQKVGKDFQHLTLDNPPLIP